MKLYALILSLLPCMLAAQVSLRPFHNFFSFSGKNKIVLKNFDEKKSYKTTIQFEQIRPLSDGNYHFIPYEFGRDWERSLIPFTKIFSTQGDDLTFKTIVLKPSEEMELDIVAKLPNAQAGSFHAIARIKVEGLIYPIISYVFVTTENPHLELKLKRFRYRNDKLDILVENTGEALVEANFQLIYQDPETGFTYKVDQMGIPNYVLPKKMVRRKYDISSHLKLFDKKFKIKYPGRKAPDVLALLSTLTYGKNHKQLKGLRKNIVINRGEK